MVKMQKRRFLHYYLLYYFNTDLHREAEGDAPADGFARADKVVTHRAEIEGVELGIGEVFAP